MQRLCQSKSRVDEVNPDDVLPELLADQTTAFLAAAELVDQRGVEMDNEPSRHQMMENRLDRRALPPLRLPAGRQHCLLEGSLALVAGTAEVAVEQCLDRCAVEIDKVLGLDRRQYAAAALHQHVVAKLDRGVATTREHKLRIRAIEVGQLNQGLQKLDLSGRCRQL